MASKEYRATVFEDGRVEWSYNGVFCCDPRRDTKRADHLKQKNEEVQATEKKDTTQSNIVGFLWCDTCQFYYRGPHEVGGGICNANKNTKYVAKPKEPVKPAQTTTKAVVNDLYWEKCKQCDSVVCRKKHACKDEQPADMECR